MQMSTIALLGSAGLVGGLVNALAGGATLITFPAMLHVGLSPVIANASNAVAISPSHLFAALADREQLPSFDRRMCVLIGVAAAGAAIGAALLLALPERLFVLPIPALIAFGTMLFAFASRIQTWVAGTQSGGFSLVGETSVLLLASVYGGFFGAGLGVIFTAILSITQPGHIRVVKVMKNLLATAVSLVAVAIFIVRQMVSWPEVLVMLVGAIVGGYAGGHLIRVIPAGVTRGLVITAGMVMTLVYADKYWL